MWANTDYTLNVVNGTTLTSESETMNPLTGEVFVKGEMATFKYHDKLRVGKVEKVGKDFVTLEHDEPHPVHLTKFQSYKFNKIQKV